MADIKISALPTLAGASVAVGDSFPIVDASAAATKRITLAELALSFANVTSFKVPDATADGEALAYNQAGAQLSGLTIDARYADVSVDEDSSGGNGTATFSWKKDGNFAWRWQKLSNGVLNLNRYDQSTGVFQDAPISFGVTGQVTMTGASSVTVPAATAATHAAQVSAIDATTGQLQIGGVEMGDTGWRDVSGSLVNGWTASSRFEIRRTGYQVTLVYADDGTGDNSATSDIMYGPTAGFAPDRTGRGAIPDAGSSIKVLTVTPTAVSLPRTLSTGFSFEFSWMTDDAWPASLPGTAV